jgi:hypothetical protein
MSCMDGLVSPQVVIYAADRSSPFTLGGRGLAAMSLGRVRGRMRRSVESACAVFLVGVLAIAAAGCGGGDEDRLPPATTPSQTLSPTPTIDPLDAAVLAALDGYIAAIVAARTNPDSSDHGLENFATDDAVTTLTNNIRANLREGNRYTGSKRIVVAEIIERNLDVEQPNVYVETCLDVSDYALIDIVTGEVLAGSPFIPRHPSDGPQGGEFADQHPAWFRFYRTDDDQWLMSTFVGLPEESC